MSTSPAKNAQPASAFRAGILALAERVGAMALTVISTMMLFRILTKEDFAVWGYYLLCTYFVEMGRSGLLQNGLIRLLARAEPPSRDYRRACDAALYLSLAYSALSSLALWLLAPTLAHAWKSPMLATLLPYYVPVNFVMMWYMHANYVQQSRFEFRGIFWGALAYRGALFAYVFGVWKGWYAMELTHLPLSMLAGAILAGAASWWFARPHLRHAFVFEKKTALDLLNYGRYVLGTNLSAMFYKSVDKMALGYWVGPAAFSVYEAASRITQLIEMPSFSIAQVLFPRTAVETAKADGGNLALLYERSVAAVLGIVLPFIVGVLLFAEPLVRFFAGERYADASDLLRITAFFGLFLPFAVQFGAVTDATGRAALNFRVTLFTALLNLGLSALMIPPYGLYGAAWATLCGYAISFAIMQFLLQRLFGVRWYRAFGHIGSFYLLAWEKIQTHWERVRSPQARL